jgi:hypothetical protein
MTREERIQFLQVVCDFNEVYKEKESYKAYLQSAAEHRFIPGQDWEEICQRLQADPSMSEIQDFEFVTLYEYATQGLAHGEAQALLEEVRKIRKNLRNPVH